MIKYRIVFFVFFLTAFLSCKKEKTAVTEDAKDKALITELIDLAQFTGTYSMFDKQWNLFEYTIFKRDTIYFAKINYKQHTEISPIYIVDTLQSLYAFKFRGQEYNVAFRQNNQQEASVRFIHLPENPFVFMLENKGFIDLNKTEHTSNQAIKNQLNPRNFKSTIRPTKNDWSGFIYYTDTLRYLYFDDASKPLRAICITQQKDTVSLSYDIPIGAEFNGLLMEMVWKIDTVMMSNQTPVLNHKLIRYRVIR